MKDLQHAGVYAKTDCINALDTSEGDTEKAILTLEKMAMRPMLQRVLNSCLPDSATQEEVFMALTRQSDSQTPQDRFNFEAIVKDMRQDRDVSNVALLLVIILSMGGNENHSFQWVHTGVNYSIIKSIIKVCS